MLELTPDLVGPTITHNAGIIGEAVDINVQHLRDVRPSSVVFNLTQRLLYTKWRDPGEDPKLYLFGQLKRITRQWLDNCLVCKGNTYTATAHVSGAGRHSVQPDQRWDHPRPRRAHGPSRPCSTPTTRPAPRPTSALRPPRHCAGRQTGSPPKNHVNWVVLDSDWEAELCRVAEAHPQVVAYTKNHNLGLEVPYRYGSTSRKYRPDFIVLVDDGRTDRTTLLHLVVEIKGYRGEDAKDKKSTMDTYWVPGVNYLGAYGRWTFAELTDVYQIQFDFEAKVKGEFHTMIESVTGQPAASGS